MTDFFDTMWMAVRKNFALLFRDRAGSVLAIIGPLLLILFAGIAYDNFNLYSVNVGTYAPDYSNLTLSFINNLAKNQVQISRYNTENNCRESVLKGAEHVCIVFSSNFTAAQAGKNHIIFYVDYSRMNLVWAILNVMSSRLSESSKSVSTNLTSQLVKAIYSIKDEDTKMRQVMLSLATDNEDATTRSSDVAAEFSELNLDFDTSIFRIEDLGTKRQKLKQWVDSALSIADSSLRSAQSYIGTVHGSVKDNPDLQAAYASKVNDLEALRVRLQSTNELATKDFEEFSSIVNDVVDAIHKTQGQVDQARWARQRSLENFDKISVALERSLLNLLIVQSALNNVRNMIDAIEVTDPGSITDPVITTIKPVVAPKSYLNYLFPVIAVLVLMFAALLLAPIVVMLERHSPAYFRNYMLPVSPFTFFASIFLTVFIIVTAQSLIIFLLAAIFGTSFSFAAAGILILLAMLFVLMGMIVGYALKNEQNAIITSLFLGFLLLFFSGTIIPIESMPATINTLAKINPFVIGSSLLRSTIVYQSAIRAPDIILLVIYTLAAFFISLSIYYKTELAKLLSRARKKWL